MSHCRVINPRRVARPTFQSARCLFACNFTDATRRCRAAPMASQAQPITNDETLSPRWLSDLRNQIKTSLAESSDPARQQAGKQAAETLDHSWLELMVASEGFIVTQLERGLSGHKVVWGDQDSMVGSASVPRTWIWDRLTSSTGNATLGHVNNVVYNKFAESSRVNYMREFAHHADQSVKSKWRDLMSPRGTGIILKSIRTDYKVPLVYPDAVSVLHKLATRPGPGAGSFLLECVIVSHNLQRPAARCFEDIVVIDYGTGKPAVLEDFMAEEFSSTYDEQERKKTEAVQKVRELQNALTGA